jgi:hypothetical protein
VHNCIQEFRQQLSNFVTISRQLVKQIHACVDKFRETGLVRRKSGSGTPRKRTADCIAGVQRRIENSPKNQL